MGQLFVKSVVIIITKNKTMLTNLRKWWHKERAAIEKEKAAWTYLLQAQGLKRDIAEDLENYKINTDVLEEKTAKVEEMKKLLPTLSGDAYNQTREDIDFENKDIASIDERNNALMDGIKSPDGKQWVSLPVNLRKSSAQMVVQEANKLLSEAKKIRQAKI